MNVSVLEKKNVSYRPFSQNELQHLRLRLYNRLFIGKTLVEHPECGHFYYAKANGRKEKEVLACREQNKIYSGNCSVCWKINHTPERFKNDAKKLVNRYCSDFSSNREYLTYEIYSLENDFYTWLYVEFNPDKIIF